MKFSLAILTFLLGSLLFAPFLASAQTVQDQTQGPVLLDEFGRLKECDLGSRFDHFLISLQNAQGSEGYVIVYSGLDQLPGQRQEWWNERLFLNHVAFRRFDRSRITVLRGGLREAMATEFWIVPSGAESPQPSKTISAPGLPTKEAFLFDRRHIVNEEYIRDDRFLLPSAIIADRLRDIELGFSFEEDGLQTEPEAGPDPDTETPEDKFHWFSGAFGKYLLQNHDTTGTIILYADDHRFDIPKLEAHINELLNVYEQDEGRILGRVRVVYGGYRESVIAEFFVVPAGSPEPLPTPEERRVNEIDWEDQPD